MHYICAADTSQLMLFKETVTVVATGHKKANHLKASGYYMYHLS
jgi:hypothetical protein